MLHTESTPAMRISWHIPWYPGYRTGTPTRVHVYVYYSSIPYCNRRYCQDSGEPVFQCNTWNTYLSTYSSTRVHVDSSTYTVYTKVYEKSYCHTPLVYMCTDTRSRYRYRYHHQIACHSQRGCHGLADDNIVQHHNR